MRVRKMLAGAALGMSLVMSVNAFAAGSITGIIENVEGDFSDATDSEGNPIDDENLTIHIVEEFEAPYFSSEEGEDVLEEIDAVNDGTKTLEEAFPDVQKDEDITVDLSDLGLLTRIDAVIIRDQDENIIEDAKNVGVSFDLNNIPDDAELYVLIYNATDGWTLRSVKIGAVLGDGVFASLNGNTLSLFFTDIEGAAFAVLYKTSENTSAPTGDFGRALPTVTLIAVVALMAVVVFRRKRA